MPYKFTSLRKIVVIMLFLLYSVPLSVLAADRPQWGQRFSRNMVSSETGLPDTFDPDTGKNIKWVAPLGTESYATPVIASGRVFIGTNNKKPRDPRHQGDRGIMLCLDEKDGSLCWQLTVPKIPGDPFLDWPNAGLCSPPTVEGDRVYAVSNRGEVMCLDIHGQKNGNDGPLRDEGRLLAPPGESPFEITPFDADILWSFDMKSQAGIYPHDTAHSAILLDGDFLYLNTGNGVDNTHRRIRAPDAPSLIVLDKHTGRLLAKDNQRIGPRIFHSTWSPPALGFVDGRKQIFFAGGDGILYGFEPLKTPPSEGRVHILKNLWRYDGDPNAPKQEVHRYTRNRRESPSNVKSTPVFHKGRLFLTLGGDIWWGKNKAWIQCINPGGSGDISRSHRIWSYPLRRHCCSTPAIYNNLAFVADCGGFVYCLDARTGRLLWEHDTGNEIWASPLVADGKVYLGNRRRTFSIFAAAPEKKLLASLKLDSAMDGTPVAANRTLYVTTMKNLYAISLQP